jgi:hypothetical protein
VRLFSTVTLVRVGNQAPEFSQGALSPKRGWPKREASSPRNRQAIRIVQPVSCPALSVPGNASFLNRILALKQITRCPALQVLLQRPFSTSAKENPAFPGLSADYQGAFGEVHVLKSRIQKFATTTSCGIEHFQDRAIPYPSRSTYQS